MKILGTGLTGLVGSRIVKLLKDIYDFENISRSTGTDITNEEQVRKKIISSDAQIVLHLAGATNVDECELNKEDANKLNVLATEYIARSAQDSNKKLIYVSTDFVFDGEIGENEFYTENDEPHPINEYGRTKYKGEQIVKNMKDSLIIRIAYPYRNEFDKKHDFVKTFRTLLQGAKDFSVITDHYMTPTFVDDIAVALDKLIENNATGIFHVVGNSVVSPKEALSAIQKIFQSNWSVVVRDTTREEFFKNRAKRPYRLALKNDKLQRLGIEMKTFEEGLIEIKRQINNKS